METVISMSNVFFNSHDKCILKKITKNFYKNEKILLLGPNGCGKSTLLKVLAGTLKANGEITICGDKSHSYQAKLNRSFVPQQLDFPAKITVNEIINFIQSHYSDFIPKKDVIDIFGLKANDLASTLSGGQKRRLALALALLSKPKLLLLDEPETGLDVQFRESVLKEIILRTSNYPMTLIVASHFFESATQHFDRVLIMKEGEIIFDHSMNHFLKIKNEITRWDIQADEPLWVIQNFIQDRYRFVRLGSNYIRLYAEQAANSLHELQKASWGGKTLTQQNVTTEDIYLFCVGG